MKELKEEELKLENVERDSVTYVLIMRMGKLNFVEFEYDMERMGQTKSGL
jgi:hypothetical protein